YLRAGPAPPRVGDSAHAVYPAQCLRHRGGRVHVARTAKVEAHRMMGSAVAQPGGPKLSRGGKLLQREAKLLTRIIDLQWLDRNRIVINFNRPSPAAASPERDRPLHWEWIETATAPVGSTQTRPRSRVCAAFGVCLRQQRPRPPDSRRARSTW